ncbi:PAS domain S-box protein [Roseivirga pacifica]
MDNVFRDTLDNLSDAKIITTDLSSVLSNLTEVIWSIDLTNEPYRYTYHNNPTENLGTHSKITAFPETVEEWQANIHPEDRDRVLEELVNALSNKVGSYAYRMAYGNGEYAYFRDKVSVLYENNKPIRLDGITIDIDTVRRNRLNLELSQQRLKSIVDALPDPVFISVKESGKVIFSNEVLFKVYEMSPSDFLGKKVIHFLQNFQSRKSYLDTLNLQGHIQNHEMVLKNKKGETFWVSASTMPLEFNNQDCYITILQDITLRKKLENEIKETNERYHLAVEGTNDVVWEYDFRLKSSYLSPQFWEGMEIEPEQNPLDDKLIAAYLHSEDRSDFLSLYSHKVANGEQDLTLEARLVAKNERIIWALIKARIIYNEEGAPARVVGSMSNITSLKLAQAKLRESEAKYKIISEHSSDCICLQAIDGTFVFVSPSSKEILGYTPEELVSLRLREIIDPEYLQKVSDTMLKVLNREQRSATVVYKAIHKNGNAVWLETMGGSIFDDDDNVLYLQTSTRNVTERILSEEMLRESEERYKLITENSHDIVSLMDLEGNYVFITPSVKDALGYDPAEMVGMNYRDFLHEDDIKRVDEEIAGSISENSREVNSVFRYRHKSGEWRWISASGGLITDDEGNPIYLRANKIDVTEKRKTEEKLRQQEERYKLVSENSGDVIALHRMDGTIDFASPSCKRLLGFDEKELVGTDPIELIKEEHREYVKTVIATTAVEKGRDVKMTFEIRHKDQGFIWVETSLSVILDSKGEAHMMQTSTRDISERIKALEKERQLNKLKSSFISMASHEFRTPLTTIQSSNELISMYLDKSDSPVDNKLGKHVSRIRTELERLNSLLKDVFTLGRLDVGKARLKKDITSLSTIAKQVVLESSIPYKGRNVEIKVEGTERQVLLDSQLISHVLSNLISNALKYSPDKKDPVLTIVFQEQGVQLKVRDFGIGIPKRDQKELFESFSRASNVGDIEGTGLGLVIVKQFVEMHGGEISFTSEENKGTEFTVSLPLLD